jgi:hypothetical protein
MLQTDDDLAFVRARIPDYREYVDEDARHDTDMKVRAYVGQVLSEVAEKLGARLDPATTDALQKAIFHCQFTDYAFTKKIDHRDVAGPLLATWIGFDRKLLEAADRAAGAAPAELSAILEAIESDFTGRRNAV